MATQTRTPNATLTHLKPLSFLPDIIPSRRKPNFTPSDTPPPHSSTPVHPPVLQSLIPRSLKNKPGHRLPGRAVRARKTLLQHKSLRQARVVSPKDPHRSQLHKVVSLPPTPPQPSRTILSLSLLPSPTSWPLCLGKPTALCPIPSLLQLIAMVLLLSQLTHTPHLLLTPLFSMPGLRSSLRVSQLGIPRFRFLRSHIQVSNS